MWFDFPLQVEIVKIRIAIQEWPKWIRKRGEVVLGFLGRRSFWQTAPAHAHALACMRPLLKQRANFVRGNCICQLFYRINLCITWRHEKGHVDLNHDVLIILDQIAWNTIRHYKKIGFLFWSNPPPGK